MRALLREPAYRNCLLFGVCAGSCFVRGAWVGFTVAVIGAVYNIWALD